MPAWKKLGLKLKHGQDTTDSVTTNYSPTVNEKKRKRSSDNGALQPTDSFNKLRKNAEVKSLGSPTDVLNPDPSPLSPGQSTTPSDPEADSRPKKTRKSVSFTPDTKKTDGDSIKQLYKTWFNSQLAKDPSFDPSAGNPALQVITPLEFSFPTSSSSLPQPTQPTQLKKAKKPKGPKRSKEQKNPSNHEAKESSSSPRQATLDYLHTYHTSPSSWKFSKSRQTYLLRNLFSPGFLPPSYDTALKAYLSGLQGEGAKSRLRTTARKVMVEAFRGLGPGVRERWIQEGYAREKKRHMDWLEREVKALEKDADLDKEKEIVIGEKELSEKYWIKRIADTVLWSIGDDPESETNSDPKDNDNQKPTPTANEKNTSRRKRKHKNRSSEMSSSSDDDDDTSNKSSSSSSSSESDTDARLARNLANLQKATSQLPNPKRARPTEDPLLPSNAATAAAAILINKRKEQEQQPPQAKPTVQPPKRSKPSTPHRGDPSQTSHTKYGSPYRPKAAGLIPSPPEPTPRT